MSFPPPDAPLTHLLVVSDISRAIEFYRDVLGAELDREYGSTSAVFSFNGAWILLVTGGGPTPDKPGVAFASPADPKLLSHAMTIRVPNCREAYRTLVERGAEFLIPPIDNGPEIRCFFRDPDGHLFEINEFRAG